MIPPRPCADAVVNVETPTPPKIVASWYVVIPVIDLPRLKSCRKDDTTSLVLLFFGSFTFTIPMVDLDALVIVPSGSPLGLSSSVFGYNLSMLCESL